MSEASSLKNDRQNHYNSGVVWKVIGMSMGAISFAYAGSVIGTTLGQPSFFAYMALATNPNAEALIGATTSLFYVGGILGCVLNSWMADRFGRKMTLIFASIVLIIGSACTAGSVDIGMFIAFRFVTGFGAYMNFLTVPIWTTELVPPKGRGILSGINGLFGVIGYILAAYVGVGFFYYKTLNSSQWRAPLAIGCAPPLVLICISPWLPESPRWLLSKDRGDQAWEIVKRLHTTKDDPNHEYATAEFYQMRSQMELERSLDSSWLEILRRPSYRKRALIAFSMNWIFYSTGNLVLTTYAASIFAGIGYDAAQSLQLLAGTYVAAIAGNLVALTYIDRVPRNVIMSAGVIAVTCVLAIETALVAKFVGTTNQAGLKAAVAMIFLFIGCFNLFIEGVSWYYVSEIFPTHLRAKGMTIAIISFCMVNLLWLQLAPTATANIGWKYYLVFICISLPGAAVIYFLFPDTLGKPLEEVAKMFGDDDLVAVYGKDIRIDHEKHVAVVDDEKQQVVQRKIVADA